MVVTAGLPRALRGRVVECGSGVLLDGCYLSATEWADTVARYERAESRRVGGGV